MTTERHARDMQRHLAIFSCGFMTALVYGCTEDKANGTLDDDADGFDINVDCNDSNPDVHPDAAEVCDDGIDNDCSNGDAECTPGDGDGDGDDDEDNDGFNRDEDCDDLDPNVNPDAREDCMITGDENCDRYAPQCVLPDLIYAPSPAGQNDAYGVGVFAQHVVFGEPSGGGIGIGDGRALFFDANRTGTVDQADADLVSEGPVGAGSAYGIDVTRVGQELCIVGRYFDDGVETEVGKSWCFSHATVAGAASNLQLADAMYTTAGSITDDYSNIEGQADVNGDGVQDLLVYSAHGVHVIYGDGTGWSGDYIVPADADLTFGDCVGSSNVWCGFARAIMPGYPTTFAISSAGGFPDEISIYTFPFTGAPVATATADVNRFSGDSAAAIQAEEAFAFGDMINEQVTFVDVQGNILGTLQGPNDSEFGYWVTTTIRHDGQELLLVGAPEAESPEPGSSGRGLIYVFDLDNWGLPTTWRQADFILLPPAAPRDFADCGHRARAATTYDDDFGFVFTTVASACRGHGGAAYKLYQDFDGARLVAPQDVYSVGPGDYEIRQWVIDKFIDNLQLVQYLAQTEAVRNAQNETVGWRLHKIAVDSPLYRAGLRNGDVIARINGVDATTPAVVSAIYDGVKDDSALTVGFVRNGTPRLFSYAIVP